LRAWNLPYTDGILSEDAVYLARLSKEWNLTLPRETPDRLLAFVTRMMEWNVHINLTGAESAHEVVGEHLIDSFAMTRFLKEGCTVADVGAGGGLPGIPLAILRPDIHLTMIEPRAKRVAFLRGSVHEFGLGGVEVLRCRSEEAEDHSFDTSASRATFRPDEWLVEGRRLAKHDGVVLVFTNEPWSPNDSSGRLVDSVCYASRSGRTRWIGAFCFT
jgi:16S rRNA (guanine527-N7)-methyltransferase